MPELSLGAGYWQNIKSMYLHFLCLLSRHSLTLTDRWVSEDNELDGDNCLRQNQLAPDLAIVKDFIRYYIFSAKGMLTLRPVMTYVLNFAERFFGGFTRVTKTNFY